eukprot:3438897-Prymnesium_polylepis.1
MLTRRGGSALNGGEHAGLVPGEDAPDRQLGFVLVGRQLVVGERAVAEAQRQRQLVRLLPCFGSGSIE